MKNKLVWVAVLLSVVLVACGVLFYKDFERNKSAIYNAQLIADVTPAENPALKTNDINLAAFYQWTKEDPLFTGPDFNTGEFSRAVSDISKEQAAIMKADNLKEPFLPIGFWNDLVKVTPDHNNFLKNPSRPGAEKLIADYKQTLADYKSSLQTLFSALVATGPADLNINDTSTIANEAVGINNVTSLEVVEKDILKLKENADSLTNEIDRRQACLEKGLNCERPAANFDKPDLSQFKVDNSSQAILPTDLLLPFLKKSDVVLGPYTVPTACFGWNKNLTAPDHLFYVIQSTDDGAITDRNGAFPIQYTKLATDIYYKKFGLMPDDAQFKSLDIPREYEQENAYVCTDATYPARLSNLNAFWSQYHNNELYEKLLEGSADFPPPLLAILKTGESLESQFFSSRYPSESNAKILADYYAYTYKAIGSYDLIPAYRNESWLNSLLKNRDEFLNRYLLQSRGLGGLDLVFNNEDGELSRLKARATIYGTRDLPPFYVYASRSAYGLSYFSFSPSFYLLSNQLSFLMKETINTTDNLSSPVIDYYNALSRYSPTEIRSWFIKTEESALEVNWKKLSARK